MASGHRAGMGSVGGAMPSATPPKHPYAHFDDIKHAAIDVDSVTPVGKVLAYAEACINQADILKDFGRLDMALKEYIRASIVLLEVLPSNTAWMSVMTDQKGARTRYNTLMGRISADSATYERIKTLIKEDNARTGVQPKAVVATGSSQGTAQQHASNGTAASSAASTTASITATNGHRSTAPQSLSNGDGRSMPPPSAKTKPAVHPKPHALVGNAIPPSGSSSNSSGGDKMAQDLAKRFANLRADTSITAADTPPRPVQDPRIRTQPINHPSFLQLQQHNQHQHQHQHQNQQARLPQSPPLLPTQTSPSHTPTHNQPQAYQQFQSVQPPPKAFDSLSAAMPLSRPGSSAMMHPLPDLPKVPDAIYSPARGSVSSQAAQMPTSTPRGMFSRTNSVTSFSTLSKPPSQAPTDDYFSFPYIHSRQSSRPSLDSTRPRKPRAVLPEGDTITAQELLKLMQAGSKDVQLLIIDIRSREEFDEGHIMSQATICVDAEILEREDISAGQIADSMVLAPAAEVRLFDRRGDVDLVVFYDEDSEAICHNGQASSRAGKTVAALYNALAYYDYQSGSDSSRRPKLLKGGIEAWISLMGHNALQTSSTAGAPANRAARAARAATRRPRQNTFTRPHTKYMAKPIQDADEAKRWEESLKNMEKSSFVRTTDDFLRRFPPVSAIQESMTSPMTTRDDAETSFHVSTAADTSGSFTITPLQDSSSSRPTAVDSEHWTPTPSSLASAATTAASTASANAATAASLYSSLPAPPARPAPTVPRQTHNDVAESEDEDHYMRTKLAKAGVKGGRLRRQKVGLQNPDNWCYGNSSFQSLFASGSFADELTTGEWLNRWKVPMKADEKISHPQLLAKILANSFHWMQYGKFESMKAKTLMDYCYHIHSREFDGSIKTDRSTIFGGPYQQDAQEFISFLLENLHDETNRLRDRAGEVQQPPLKPQSTALGNALLYWHEYRKYNDSLVDKFWRGVEVTDRRCRSCGHPSLTYEHFDAIHLPIPPNTASTATTMADLLGQYCGADVLPEYRCDQCHRIDTTEKRVRLVRLPDLLCISFRRFQGNEHYGFHKNNTAVVFPINGLDMTPYTVQGRTAPAEQEADGVFSDERTEHQFRAPFIYDCYAVIVHSGTLKSGHYRSFIKDEGAADTNQWHHFDDARIEPVIIGSNDSRDMARRLYRDNNNGASAYMVFYKRRT